MRKLLFLGKKDDFHAAEAQKVLQGHFDVDAYFGEWGDPFPVRDWRGDVIISYLSRWIVPKSLLARARTALNFHPATPDYPGIGCINFALYNDVREFGATCHIMRERVDTGPIVSVIRFEVSESDDVASLLARTYDAQFALFVDIASKLADGVSLLPSGEHWRRKPYTREEFDRLCILTADMSEEEVARRTRATSYGKWGPRRVS